MEIRRNNLTTANQNSKITDLLDNLTEQELELVVGGTDNLTNSITVKTSLETSKYVINKPCWANSGGGGSGSSGGSDGW